MKTVLSATALAVIFSGSVSAAPVTYEMDPNHTQASFEADHMGGLSIRRGKFDTTKSGTVVLDREAQTGTVDVTIDATSMDTGLPKLNDHIKSDEMLDAATWASVGAFGTAVGLGVANILPLRLGLSPTTFATDQ